jgi:Rrf2 family protein
MKLSTRTRYGTRALLELALRETKGPVYLKDIAKNQQISLSYLEHLVAPLISGGIISSTKGPRGGITLARKPENINMKEITYLLEGSLAPVDCVDHAAGCDRSGFCVTREIWGQMKDAMDGILEKTTLKDLVERQKEKRPGADDFYI